MATESYTLTWNDVFSRLREEPANTVVQIAVADIEHPRKAGMYSMPANADDGRPMFGTVLDEQTGYIVHDCGEHYLARLCRIPQMQASAPSSAPLAQVGPRTELVTPRRPERRSLARLPADEPGLTLLLTALGCSAVGLAFGGRNGALYGAMLGIGTGLASIAVATAATSPATALTAQTMFLGLAAAGLGGQGGARVLRLAPMREPARPARRQDATSPPQTSARRRSRKK